MGKPRVNSKVFSKAARSSVQYQKFFLCATSIFAVQVVEGKSDIETHRETEKHREKDRNRDRQTQTDRLKAGETHMYMARHIAAHLVKHTAEGQQKKQPWFETEADVQSSLPLPHPSSQTTISSSPKTTSHTSTCQAVSH